MHHQRPQAGSRERDIFLDALEIDPGIRAQFLDRACGNDITLRSAVEALLQNHQEDDFLSAPAITPPHRSASTPGVIASERPGDMIGRYKLLQEIGEGGCGTVYMAEQEEPVRRRVALKIIKLGMDTKSVIARFEAERQALAMMDHQNIAKVLDAGTTETGRPYFVMELVRGIRITDYCDQNQLTTRERLILFIKVCNAIQHAHQKGIIHRDIKPSNILVTLHDGVPVPKVIDFGIAKAIDQRLTDKTVFTQFQSFIGTPAYTSPEQAEMSGLDIDTRSDIYSLGVLLYEMLTGKTPFDGKQLAESGLDQMRKTIREAEPLPPSTRLSTMVVSELAAAAGHRQTEPAALPGLMRGDLDWIVMKALEKDRTRRYVSAHEFAADVQRYIDNEPVEARPPSNTYRLQKLVLRHYTAFLAGTAVAVALIAGTTVSTIMAIRARHAGKLEAAARQRETELRKEAEQGQAAARINEYVADMNLAHQSLLAGNFGLAVQLVERHRPKTGEPDLRGFEWRYLWQLCQGNAHVSLPSLDGPVHDVAFSPDGNLLAVAGHEKLMVWDFQKQAFVKTFKLLDATFIFLPDGKTLITDNSSGLRAWSTEDWSEKAHFPEAFGTVAVSQVNGLVACASGGKTVIWDSKTWKAIKTIEEAFGRVAFSPDGKNIAAHSRDGISVWEIGAGTRMFSLKNSKVLPPPRMGFSNRLISFSPDGNLIVAPVRGLGNRVRIWDAHTGEDLGVLPKDGDSLGHSSTISSLDFSPDGKILVTGSWDHSIRIWNAEDGKRLALLQGNLGEVWSVDFSPDGTKIASGSKDGGIKIWPLRQEEKEQTVPGVWQTFAVSKDGRTLTALNNQGVAILNLATREPEEQIAVKFNRQRGFWQGPLLSADARTLAYRLDDGSTEIKNLETHQSFALRSDEGRIDLLMAISANGRYLVAGQRERFQRLWDLRENTNRVIRAETHRVLFSPDNKRFAILSRDQGAQIWDLATCSARTTLTAADNPSLDLAGSYSLAFSLDGRIFGLGCMDNTVRLWDSETGAFLGQCSGHKQGVHSIAFSPDNKTLSTCSSDGVKLWNLTTFQELLTLSPSGTYGDLVFTSNGHFLVGQTLGGLSFYSAPSFQEIDRRNRR